MTVHGATFGVTARQVTHSARKVKETNGSRVYKDKIVTENVRRVSTLFGVPFFEAKTKNIQKRRHTYTWKNGRYEWQQTQIRNSCKVEFKPLT